MVGYPNSLLSVPSFCDNQQSTWRDVPLEGLHTGTTPTPMKRTKVSYYAWFWLWPLVVVTSCTKMMCVLLLGSWHRCIFTNNTCLTFQLQFQTTANTLNQCYIVSWYSYRWIWPGVPYMMIHGGIPQFTVVRAIIREENLLQMVLWKTVHFALFLVKISINFSPGYSTVFFSSQCTSLLYNNFKILLQKF